SQDIGFYAGVIKSRSSRGNPLIELHNTVDRSYLGGRKRDPHAVPQAIEVASSVFGFSEIDARGHMQEIADRSPAVLGSLEAGHISIRSIIDRLDCSFGDCDT